MRILNINDGATVSQRMTIVHGELNSNSNTVVRVHHQKYPSMQFPAAKGLFKAFVHLDVGDNKITFETDNERHELRIRYGPLTDNPPVHFCLLLAKDSPERFDSPPHKCQREGNDVAAAVRKLRMAAYMMAAFTQEQMSRNNFGFRSFTPYQQEDNCSISFRDKERRNTVYIHIVRLDKTLAEIRDPDVAQQYDKATRKNDLFSWAAEGLQKYGGPFKEGFSQAACIYLDTHWDTSLQTVLGHAALGGSTGDLKLAIFGGHTLHSWPNCVEDLPSCFMDATPTDTNVVANDANQSGTSWEALCIGQGAFMHEIGHLLGCPHQPSGVMLRGYLNWNRSFMATEAYSKRLNRCELEKCTVDTEGYWHRLDILRFRYHRSFRLPGEPRYDKNPKPSIYPTGDGVLSRAPNGIYMIDFQVDGMSKGHLEALQLPTEVRLSLNDIKNAVDNNSRNKKINAVFHAPYDTNSTCEDVENFVRANSGSVLRSTTAGTESGNKIQVNLPVDRVTKVRVYSGLALDGIEFFYANADSVMLGNRGGSPHDIKIADGDEFLGLQLRSGMWVDAAGVITRNGRSEVFGGTGGGYIDLIPPDGKPIVGMSGWYQNWCYGLAIHYQR